MHKAFGAMDDEENAHGEKSRRQGIADGRDKGGDKADESEPVFTEELDAGA